MGKFFYFTRFNFRNIPMLRLKVYLRFGKKLAEKSISVKLGTQVLGRSAFSDTVASRRG